MVILCFLLMTVFVIIRMHDLFTIVLLMSIYGLLSASFFILMDAVDVALTEAAVGIVISILLFLCALSITGRNEKHTRHNPLLACVLVTMVGCLLIYGTLEMPPFGSANAPVHQHVAAYYINESFDETGVANFVSSVLASYRGYDTLGELFVIFTAGVGVTALIGINEKSSSNEKRNRYLMLTMVHHPILQIVAKMLIPLILLFAFYIQFHGDFGPGGGFQAGAIFASGFILYTLIFGFRATLKVINQEWLAFFSAIGVLIYGSTGVVSLLMGKNFLDYHVLATDPIQGQHFGILIVELGVGITVASVILLIFISFTRYMQKQDSNR